MAKYKIRSDVNGLSPLAHQVGKLKDGEDRTADVFGLVVHTTGSGIVEQARKRGADPLEWAVAFYQKPDSYWSHYVIGYDGTIVQISDEHEKALHVGCSAANRQAYLDGSWTRRLSKEVVGLWSRAWPEYRSPQHIFPGASPNNVFVGAELLPIVPAPPGLRFTVEQHRAVGHLGADIRRRWGIDPTAGIIVGHEDVGLLDRSDKSGGWDPGGLRDKPWFDWDLV